MAKAWKTSLLGELLVTHFDGAWGDLPGNGGLVIPVLRSTEMRAGTLVFGSAELRCFPARTIERKKLVPGDILVNKSSGSARLVGLSVLFPSPPDNRTYLCSNFVHCLRPNQLAMDSEFLSLALLSPQFREQVFQAQNTTSGLRNLSLTEYLAADITYPNLPEQRRLVARIKDCLSRVEEMQRLREEAEAGRVLILSATLRELFKEAANQATPCSVGTVTLESQYGTNVKCNENGDGIPILRIPNVAGGFVNLKKLKFAPLSQKEQAKVRLRRGDLLVVRTNGSPDLVGRCAVFQETGTFGYASYLIRFRLDPAKVLPTYVSFFLQSPGGREAIARIRQTSAGQYNVNSENLRNIVFPLAKLPAQAALVEKAFAVQRIADSISDELVATGHDAAALRESILREAFAGNL